MQNKDIYILNSIKTHKGGFISIIIVNWNGKKWLKKCFDSLMSQTYKNFEIIFVDNASADDSISYVKKNYKNSRIKIIKSNKNLGFAGGNNLGIKAANGEYILLINNDTWFEKEFLENIFKFYRKNNFDVIAPLEAKYDGTKMKYGITSIDLFGHQIYLINRNELFYLIGVCLFFSKKLYKETMGLDNNFFMYFEETDWFWRLILLNKKFSYIDDLYIYHNGAGKTGSGIKYNIILWCNKNTLQMLLKNYRWYNLVWVLPIYIVQNVIEIFFFLLIFKPKIAYSYVEGWIFNIINFKTIMERRRWVQQNRQVGDSVIIKKMYWGLSKIQNLINLVIYSFSLIVHNNGINWHLPTSDKKTT